jgi:predicted RNA-binding protein with PIN domain
MMRYVIVDGYNVLFREARYAKLAEVDLDAARARLVEDVASWAAGEKRAVVVFDGAGNPGSDGRPHHVAGVTVLFSRAGQDADAVVEALALRYRDAGHTVLVATSDAETQATVMGEGALRMSASEFAGELADARAEAREHASTGSRRGRLEDRIDPDLRERLARWARGA